MKRLILSLLTIFFLSASISDAQTVSFGLTNGFKNERLELSVIGPNNLSYSVQYSPDSTNQASFTPISLPGGFIGSKITFIQTNLSKVGYYRTLTVSNSVTYYSTNLFLFFRGNVVLSNGNRQILVLGPTNEVYVIESSANLTNWSPAFTGILGQTNFIDPGTATRFYRAKRP